ncbi:hypothetical protein CY34DRAFT_18685 [Suillus luteus UH-Slu-Lm8-n1]|uniref:Uncharacterized protein n=1 Tax=Suillus luteus UH-Slu-Lm8-n1 TaxID=930992 RepID=A0A0D0AFJ1_9AGAM|nr:hypothetical protein CY34DRAFT_18685 [Suillus luteus UH-Slu-Lm8-n1]
MPSSISPPRCPQAPSLSSNQVDGTLGVESSSIQPSLASAAVHPPGEPSSAGSSFQGNISIPASNADIGTTSMEEDDLSLAQRRGRRTGVRMALLSLTACSTHTPIRHHSTSDIGTGMAQHRSRTGQSFQDLLDIIGCPNFDPNDVRLTHWDKINSQLGASVEEEEGDEWQDEDAGWRKTEVTIDVPFSRTTAQPDIQPYIAADLYSRSLVLVIREKLANTEDDEHFIMNLINYDGSLPIYRTK